MTQDATKAELQDQNTPSSPPPPARSSGARWARWKIVAALVCGAFSAALAVALTRGTTTGGYWCDEFPDATECGIDDAWSCTNASVANGSQVLFAPLHLNATEDGMPRFECTRVDPPVEETNSSLNQASSEATWWLCDEFEEPVLAVRKNGNRPLTWPIVGAVCSRSDADDVERCWTPVNAPVCGRPFYDGQSQLVLAELEVQREHFSCTSSQIAEPQNSTSLLTEDTLREAARRWLESARHEHASVASFAKFSLDLLALGAPPSLITAALEAGKQEISHTQLSLDVANVLSGVTGRVGTFPINQVPVAQDLATLALAVAREGAIGETSAAFVAIMALRSAKSLLEAAQEPREIVLRTSVVQALETIVREETSHALLAWKTLKWAIAKDPSPGKMVHQIVSEVFERELGESGPAAVPLPAETVVDGWGKPSEARTLALTNLAERRLIRPMWNHLTAALAGPKLDKKQLPEEIMALDHGPADEVFAALLSQVVTSV